MSKGIFREITTSNRVDESGNPIYETKQKEWVGSKDPSEPFFFTYINCISWIYGLTSVTTIKILYKLLERMDYNTNHVEISSKKRSEIIEDLHISDSSFTKSLNQLIKLNILAGSRGSYTVDENFFWRGDRKTRDALIKSKVKMTLEPISEEQFENEYVDKETGEIKN